jgi:glycosyltransferase involved in cell wall biosynthesis
MQRIGKGECGHDAAVGAAAFDVSTSWHHRGYPPVGITRTEIEFAKHFLARRPDTILTVYDQTLKQHLTLPEDQGRELLGIGLGPKKATDTAGMAPKVSRQVSETRLERTFASWLLTGELATYLLALLVLSCKSSAYGRLKQLALKRLAKHGSLLSDKWRSTAEKKLRAHPTRPKYLNEYLKYRSRYGGRPIAQPKLSSQVAVLDFSSISRYITVGCCWDMNDLEKVYHEKQKHGFSVTTCVYDLVPMVMPDVVAPSLNQIFPPYVNNLLWCSDNIACISESTKTDLQKYIDRTGAPSPSIEVCRLGYAPDVTHSDEVPAAVKHLVGRPFALYVATIEPRKNHDFLHFLWNQLFDRAKVEPIPLVLAGRQGWRTENLVERMRLNTKLAPNHLVLAEGLSDAEIAWLYQNCRFTVFPSLYEGWGLPISESLFHGKFCIAADNSSLREAGQGLLRHIDLLDGREWVEEVERCIEDDRYLLRREEYIKQNFQSRQWREAGADFFMLAMSADRPAATQVAAQTRRAA